MVQMLNPLQTWDILWVIQFVKAYYNNTTDKKKAIKEIIELNYSDSDSN